MSSPQVHICTTFPLSSSTSTGLLPSSEEKAAEAALYQLSPMQDLVTVSPELLSVFVKSNLSSVPIEETDSEVSFQFADILTDGRLTYA